MDDDAVLARILRRWFASDEYWSSWYSEALHKGDLTLDGVLELSLEEAFAVQKYAGKSAHPA